jgi:UDP-glucose 4-epimerase
MKILVTGGAGYIGSVTVKRLLEKKHDVTVLDNLIYGHRESVTCPLIVEDLTNKDRLFSTLKNSNFDAVIHFAAYALAGESMTDPYKYFYNNIQGGLNLLELMKEKSIKYIIFSSSCSVYGNPNTLPVIESTPISPVSVYGESKAMFENILSWYSKIFGIKYVALRYFNAAGASLDGTLGENHSPETHIIPTAISCAIKDREFSIFGKDYKTPDGTCIRDYIHVEDLANVHILALQKIIKENKNDIYNIGSGKGYSNLEIVRMVEDVSNTKLKLKYEKPRLGDPPVIYANNKKATDELGFIPKYSELRTIIETAYNWLRHD